MDRDPIQRKGSSHYFGIDVQQKAQKRLLCCRECFGILKKTFREFLTKTKLHVSFVPNAFTTCCLLHNFLQSQSKSHIQILIGIIDVDLHVNPKLNASRRVIEVVEEQGPTHIVKGQKRSGEAMCKELSVYLGFIT